MRTRVSNFAPIVAAVVVVAVAVAGWLITLSVQHASDNASDWETVSGRLQADMAVSHVWLEERLSGDHTVNVRRDVFQPLGAARNGARVLLDGGRTDSVRKVERVNVADVRSDVQQVASGLDLVERLTRQRLASGSAAGTPADAIFDAAFRKTLTRAEALPPRMHALRDAADRRAERTEIVAVLLLGLALILAGRLIRGGERRLERVAREREAVLESAGEGIITVDADGTIGFANTAAGVLLGAAPGELAGTPITTYATSDAAGGAAAAGATDWLAPRRGWRSFALRRADGTVFPIEYTATAPEGAGAPGSVVVTFRDITARRRREREREEELRELRAIRETLVPGQVPRRADLELATTFVPAQQGVAGDFYFVSDGPGDTTILAIGDVAGKGLAAARRATFVRAALATFASYSDSPAQLLELVNRSLLERGTDPGLLVTAACAVVEPGAERVTWALAGHPPPLRLDDGTPMRVRQGLPLGIASDTGAEDAVDSLRSGAGFVLFTDGLTEARGPWRAGRPSRLGAERVQRIVGGLRAAPARVVVESLREEAERFSAGALADDLCVLAVRNRAARQAAAAAVRAPA